jgi:hypothetical protein
MKKLIFSCADSYSLSAEVNVEDYFFESSLTTLQISFYELIDETPL